MNDWKFVFCIGMVPPADDKSRLSWNVGVFVSTELWWVIGTKWKLPSRTAGAPHLLVVLFVSKELQTKNYKISSHQMTSPGLAKQRVKHSEFAHLDVNVCWNYTLLTSK